MGSDGGGAVPEAAPYFALPIENVDVPHPYATASFVTKLSYGWVTKLIALGASTPLLADDVWSLPPPETCAGLHTPFLTHWSAATASPSIPRFSRALVRSFRRDLVIALVSFLLATAAAIAQPLLVQALLQYLQRQPISFLGLENGYALMALLTLAAFLQALCVNYGFFTSYKVGVNMRSIVMDMVYDKALRLSSAARQQTTSGEIVTLMSSDAERVAEMANEGVWIIASPVTFLASLLLLGAFFGPLPALVGAATTTLILGGSLWLASVIGASRLDATSLSEQRVRVTSEVLLGIRVMKMYAWEPAVAARLQRLRDAETRHLRKLNRYRVSNVEFLFLSPLFVGASILSTYIWLGHAVDVTQIYTLIAFTNMSRHALYNFPRAIAGLSEGLGAGRRLDAYLALPEQVVAGPNATATPPTMPGAIALVEAAWTWQRGGFAVGPTTLTISPGELVMVVGGVGAGKSSFLSALAGELLVTTGEATSLRGRLAFLTQEPWIRNATIRDNILMAAAVVDEARYAAVLGACQLAHDLRLLPQGDATEIGEQGVNLSGGQKARVHLARALFAANTDVLLLDDPLSAVDVHVAQAIFESALLEFAHLKTRLLVLNSHYHFLPRADRILVLEKGQVVYDGPFTNELVTRYPEYASEPPSAAKRVPPALNTVEQSSKAAEPTALMQIEDRAQGSVGKVIYLAYFGHAGTQGGVVALALVAAFGLGQGVRIVADWFQGHWGQHFDTTAIALPHLGLYLLVVGSGALFYGRCQLLVYYTGACSDALHKELLSRLLAAPINLFYDVTPIGRILNRFARDLDIADSLLPNLFLDSLETLWVVAGALVVCALASPYVAIAYAPILLVFYYAGEYFKRTSRELKRLEGISRSPIFSSFAETLDGVRTIRAFNLQQVFHDWNRTAVDANAKVLFAIVGASRWLSLRMDVISVLLIAGITTILLQLRDTALSPTLAGLTLVYSLALISNVQWAIRLFDLTESAMTAVERLLHFKTIPTEELHGAVPPPNWPTQGRLRFENLHLRYRPELPLVLHGVSLDIAAGEKIGICGRTGAGKSSLMVALFRLAEFDAGTIYMDGVDIARMDLASLRRALAIIPQDPVLFSGSIRSNLDPFQEKSDDELQAVLVKAHLPLPLDTDVTENGANLSVGQRQLLCIGRALLRESRVVVMDEATANVDLATDALIQRTIQDAFRSNATTVLTIAHRLHTILHCDRIVVLQNGVVAEAASPAELLATPTSHFYSLAHQAGIV
ncbi:hypothetical protein SDRG_17143 [Saprolegnia diclina VS20]|uniref:Uncharacterized protein n=1 Tax=Saprolegnia diclina (strain VS20) TaxID=1156394 RepID=T0R660_SAPDV|nr:hypothetical protein SDRG_17143 [Saprolegnia diclina VS20]EQC24967.1 hypothetical protein SDRG_17143 [Saprolegnia diclina VS20]|eukprot:XP_008621600.1 hypothetical protein SDRG_17143 [Saprolegnia diclina VS20]